MDEITFSYQISDSPWTDYERVFYEILAETKKLLKISKTLSLGVCFINSQESVRLNQIYRNKDYPGDVLSFPIDDPTGVYEHLDFQEIGDIFITPEIAEQKAQSYNHTIFAELCWLFTHGLLHILGYDHEQNASAAAEMFALTDNILKVVNVEYNIV